MPWVSRALVTLWLVAVALPAAAQPGAPLPAAPDGLQFRERRVLLLPLRDLSRGAVFAEGAADGGDAERQRLLDAAAALIARAVQTDERVRPLGLTEVRERLDRAGRYRAGVAVVRERYELGRDLYNDLRLQAAAENLEAAERTAQSLNLEVLDPVLLADVELVLGLTRLEQGRPGEAHIAFKRMFALDPSRKFEAGYYPQRAEEAFAQALTDLLVTGSLDIVMDIERLEKLMADVGAHQVVTGHLERKDGELVLRMLAYDRPSRAFAFREELTADAKALDRVEWALSRWLACLVGEPAGASTARASARSFFIDSNLAYGIYLGHPTREPFNNIGFTLNFAWRALPSLDVFTKVNLYSSVTDALRDLQGSLTSVRVVVGTGVSFGGDVFTGFVYPGLDVHYLGPFSVLTDPWCKFLGASSERCDGGAVVSLDSGLLAGINLALGLRARTGEHLYLAAQANFSLYFSLFEDADLNYLVGGELGLGYTF